jgi:hypothetical protein
MISKCFGEVVLPTMTIPAIMKFGMYAYRKFLNETIASAINDDSSMIAGIRNFGSPSGMPKAPTIQVDMRIATRYL